MPQDKWTNPERSSEPGQVIYVRKVGEDEMQLLNGDKKIVAC